MVTTERRAIVDLRNASNVLKKATLSYENGFLVVNSVSTFLGVVSARVPISPVSDTEALIYGLERAS